MKDIMELESNFRNNAEGRKIAMDIIQFIFSKSQENLTGPMPWGDKRHPQQRHPNPTRISDQSTLLLSAVPPYWETDLRIVFRYDAPHASYIEWGTPPHPMGTDVITDDLAKWVSRKLRVKNQKKAIRIAWAIATKIRQEGMDAHPYVRPAAEEATRKFGLVQIKSSE